MSWVIFAVASVFLEHHVRPMRPSGASGKNRGRKKAMAGEEGTTEAEAV
jgi:hypothetical protein